jgi:hypothetical protein
MLTKLIFISFVLCCCGFAAIFGGRAGKAGAALFAGATAASIPLSYLTRDWTQPKTGVILIDLALLLGLLVLVLRSRQFWPIWAAGLHLNTVVAHFARYLVPTAHNVVYEATVAAWSLPVLLSMVIGVWLDRRAGLHESPFH